MSTTGSFDEKKHADVNVHVAVAEEVDTAAQLAAALDGEVSQEEFDRVRRKIDWHILPLMCSAYFAGFSIATAMGSHSLTSRVQSCTGSSSWTRLRSAVPLSLVSSMCDVVMTFENTSRLTRVVPTQDRDAPYDQSVRVMTCSLLFRLLITSSYRYNWYVAGQHIVPTPAYTLW